MSSVKIVDIAVEVPRREGDPEIRLTCDWEKHLHPSAATGYRVQIVTCRPSELATSSEVRDHFTLSDALRDCACRVRALEKSGWK